MATCFHFVFAFFITLSSHAISADGRYAVAISVRSLIEDGREVSVEFRSNQGPDHEKLLPEGKTVYDREGITFVVLGPGDEYVCTSIVGWEGRGSNSKHAELSFTAFSGSWEDDDIIFKDKSNSFTRADFIFDPGSRNHIYVWGVSDDGLSLFNFGNDNYYPMEHI